MFKRIFGAAVLSVALIAGAVAPTAASQSPVENE